MSSEQQKELINHLSFLKQNILTCIDKCLDQNVKDAIEKFKTYSERLSSEKQVESDLQTLNKKLVDDNKKLITENEMLKEKCKENKVAIPKQIEENKNLVTQGELDKLKADLNKCESEKKELESERIRLVRDIAEAKAQLDNKNQEYSGAIKTKDSLYQKCLDELKSKHAAQEQIKSRDETIAKLKEVLNKCGSHKVDTANARRSMTDAINVALQRMETEHQRQTSQCTFEEAANAKGGAMIKNKVVIKNKPISTMKSAIDARSGSTVTKPNILGNKVVTNKPLVKKLGGYNLIPHFPLQNGDSLPSFYDLYEN